MRLYDPLGHSEWRAIERQRDSQRYVREYEDLTGRQHSMAEDRVEDGGALTPQPETGKPLTSV